MSSIQPSNINGNFPVYGQDNPTQGFRDNFTNIKTNFNTAKTELEDLQSKAVLKSPLAGTTLDNDLNGSILTNPQLRSWTQTFIDIGYAGGGIEIDFNIGNFQKITASNNINLSIVNWPASQGFGVTGYAVMRIWFVIPNADYTVTLPAEVNIGTDDLANFDMENNALRFDTPGNYVFDISSADGGSNYLIFDNTRNRVRFRDPSFYFNPDVSPTLLIGFQDILPLAVELARTSDTIQVYGSMTSYGSVLEHGNQAGIGVYNVNNIDADLAGNANVAGYSVSTSRAYIDPITGDLTTDSRALVNSNDYIGFVNFLGLSLDPTTFPFTSVNDIQGAFTDFAAVRSFAVGSFGNIVPGGNLVLMTKRDGIDSTHFEDGIAVSTGYLHPALSLENDQSAHFYGGTVNYGSEALANYSIVDGTSVTRYPIPPDVPVLIIEAPYSSTVSSMTVMMPPFDNLNKGQKFTLSSNAVVTSFSIIDYFDTVFINELTIPAAIPGFPDTTILTIPADPLIQPGLIINTTNFGFGYDQYQTGQKILSIIDNDVEGNFAGLANVIIDHPADNPATPGVTPLQIQSGTTISSAPTSLAIGETWNWIYTDTQYIWYKI